LGPTVLIKAAFGCIGPYKVPNIKVDASCVYTNKSIASAYRGYGVPQVCWAYESQMDIIANKLGIDPLEIRLKNIVEEGYITPTEKQKVHAVGLGECLTKVSEKLSRKKIDKNIKNKKRGFGIACSYKTSKTPSGASAFIKLNFDGGVDIFVSSVEIGQGLNTVLAQIAAEELTTPFDNIRVLSADTEITPFFPATTASRSTFFAGNAVRMAAKDIVEQLFKLASEILNIKKEALALKNGAIFNKDSFDKKITITDLLEQTYPGGNSILGRGTYYHYKEGNIPSHIKLESPPLLVWMYGAQSVEVEVDTETGRITILQVLAASDVGKSINPISCEGQTEGGVLQAIGNTLYEELIYDEKGKIMNTSLLDYKIPSALDMPEINSILVENPHKEGPYGAKGLGETVVLPTAAAIGNALYDAIGVRIKDLPITPDKILRALKEKKK